MYLVVIFKICKIFGVSSKLCKISNHEYWITVAIKKMEKTRKHISKPSTYVTVHIDLSPARIHFS